MKGPRVLLGCILRNLYKKEPSFFVWQTKWSYKESNQHMKFLSLWVTLLLLLSSTVGATKPAIQNQVSPCKKGPWKSHVDVPTRKEIYIFSLDVKQSGSRLNGVILADVLGGGKESVSTTCKPGEYFYKVYMQADGEKEGSAMSFGGKKISSIRKICGGVTYDVNDYALDHFSGEVSGDRFVAKWDDYRSFHDQEIVFLLQKRNCPKDE